MYPDVLDTASQVAANTHTMGATLFKQLNLAVLTDAAAGLAVLAQAISLRNPALAGR